MGTKTADESGADTGAAAKNDEDMVDVTKADTVAPEGEPDDVASASEADDAADVEDGDRLSEARVKEPSGVGQGAGAIVSVALGTVSLTGSWVGTVASAREEITGQLEMQAAADATVATQLQAVYGDAWQATALWGGVFALAALIVGVAVLVRPAFGDPDQVQKPWIKSVAWAGVSVGFVGLVLAALKYSDILLALPST
ncbi:hypothetical protein WBG99_09695 [Streptomyces sp. TG1A-60]|uniref:hypothetical protein n=1 Tax=Streptomyces sp. TG1A-60 TaxID=3129111 RepID=UPI0030D558F7